MKQSLNIEVLVIIILVGAFGFTTSQRNFVWKDNYSLWADCVEKSYEKARPHNNFGFAYNDRGMVDKAIFHYNEALKIMPKFAMAHNNLGAAMIRQDNNKLAIYHFDKALHIMPKFAMAHNNLGIALSRYGKLNEAIYHYNRAMQLNPNYSKAYYNLAKAYIKLNKIESATHYFQEALNIDSDMKIALFNLSWIYSTSENEKNRNGIKALDLAEKLCKLTKYNESLSPDALAAAYAEVGKYDDAVFTAEKALELALLYGLGELVPGINKRLGLYKSGRPYRQVHQEKIYAEIKNK